MTNRIYSFSGEDNWSAYDSPREAMQDMYDQDDLEVGNTFLTGIKRRPEPIQFLHDADEILESYEERICDEHDWSYAQGNTGVDDITDEAKKDLNDFLKAWSEKHLNITFYEIEHDEEVEVTQEMIDAFHANEPIPMPEFKYKEPDHDNSN